MGMARTRHLRLFIVREQKRLGFGAKVYWKLNHDLLGRLWMPQHVSDRRRALSCGAQLSGDLDAEMQTVIGP
jgi:hypothetical protein